MSEETKDEAIELEIEEQKEETKEEYKPIKFEIDEEEMPSQEEELQDEPKVQEEEPEETTNEPEAITLKLGDIITFVDPTNEIIDKNTFLIDYIDKSKMKLINANNYEKVQLNIRDGVIGTGTIKELKILSRNENEGYARQNGLLPGIWINIYFGGEFPAVITGEITDLDEDMIEVKTSDGDVLFINFSYQGIPENIPIETFEIRPPPQGTAFPEPLPEEEGLEGIDLYDSQKEQEQEQEQGTEQIPDSEVRQRMKRLLMEADDIVFGDVVKIQEFVNIDKEKYRFNVEAQANDLLEELLSTIPNNQRTDGVLNGIHIMITRFLQLREMASQFDVNKNITGVVKRTADDKPLADYLSSFKNNLYWVMLVAKNVKKMQKTTGEEEEERGDDYVLVEQAEDLKEMEAKFKQYRGQKGIEGANKYVELYNSINENMTPFEPPTPDLAKNVFESPNGILVEASVQSDINAIIDNLGELYSTVFAKNEKRVRKFIIQKYNLGLDRLEATKLKGSKMEAHRVKLTKNDEIAIKSVLTLPEPTIRFSQINLPGTSLLVRANLNLHFLNYWQLLKQKTNLSNIEIDDINMELDYSADGDDFVNNIKHYMMDLTGFQNNDNITNLELYKQFLNIVIPKIRVLFNLVKKYIKGRLSMVDVIQYLEPFMIYPTDLTFMNYININRFIEEKMKEYRVNYVKYSRAFSQLKSLKTNVKYSNPLFEILKKEWETSVFQDYGIQDQGQLMSPSEFLKKIKTNDYGNLYNINIAFTNLELMYPNELNAIFEADKDALKKAIEKAKGDDTCNSYIIAKKYHSKENLQDDNNKTIFFDKEYDSTDYDIIDVQYQRERDTLSAEELELYLADQLQKKHKKDEKTATYMAETLVNRAKKVLNGHYAMLVKSSGDMPTELEYYIRKDDMWELAKDIDPQWFIRDEDVLCGIQKDCLFNENAKKEDEKCQSMDVSKETVVSGALKQIMDQFDKTYNISKDELSKHLQKYLVYYSDVLLRLHEIRKKKHFQYNTQQYDLGLKVSEAIQERVVSPYAELRDLIVGQSNFVKKQRDIIQFVEKFCRPANPELPNIHDEDMENEWWLYCVKTDTRILPKFRYLLARAFLDGPSRYNDEMEYLIKTIGKKDEDSDMWVDMHSGEQMCSIEFDVSEGFKEGFVDKSRDIMEKDATDALLEDRQKKKALTPEAQLVSNIIFSLSMNMGIDIDKTREFIIKIVTELMSDEKILEKEKVYKEREKEAVKKGKKIPEYSFVYSSTLLYLTLGMYLIAVQTSIPSIRTRKTFPGCVRSFSGFPLEGEGDDTGLEYLACVAFQYKDPTTIPWNALSRVKEDKLANTIKLFIIKYLLPHPEIEQRIKNKVEYLLTSPEKDIPEEHDISLWTNFLPPLSRFHVRSFENIGEGFTEDFKQNIRIGDPRQFQQLLVIESKIIHSSMSFQEDIQKLVQKKDLLLKAGNRPYMDNACCNEKGGQVMTALQYFISEDKDIENNIIMIKQLESILNDVKLLTESAIMLSDVDTKRVYPAVSNDFSEDTIYRAFIRLCHFQSNIPLTDDLAAICVDKPNYLRKSDSIQEKIAKLKRDGRNYTKNAFLRLFQVVSKNNIIQLKTNNSPSCSDALRSTLALLDQENDETVAPVLREKLEILLDSYDVALQEDTEEMREMKNYLDRTNNEMRKTVIDFLSKSKSSSLELKKMKTFMNELSVWQFDIHSRNNDIKISDDAFYNYIKFYKYFASLLSIVFPSMILNKQQQGISPPSYWKFSSQHEKDLSEAVQSYYVPLNAFYDNKVVINVLNEIQNRCKNIVHLARTTPAMTNIKIGDKETYSVFDKRLVTLLYEHYILQIFDEYIHLSTDSAMINKMLVVPETGERELFAQDFLVEQQLRFAQEEQEFVKGDVLMLQENVAKLLVAFINIMRKSKTTIDRSYDSLQDELFKLKEGEKYTFTDRLKEMAEEEREVDNVLKMYKLGPLWSRGLLKGGYDPENYDAEKEVATKIAEIQKRTRKNNELNVTDRNENILMEDMIEEMQNEEMIDEDAYGMGHMNEDYNDGDYYGDEQENEDQYY